VAKKPLGFSKIPPDSQMWEEERHAQAEVIVERIRDALLAEDAAAADDAASDENRDPRTGRATCAPIDDGFRSRFLRPAQVQA
jgi:hypothetical protein